MADFDNTFTVEDLLKMRSMNGARVIAGSRDPSIKATNAVVAEVPDIENWTTPGDFLLTTCYAFSNDISGMCQLVDKLWNRGVVGMAIKPHRFIGSIPQEMIEAADKTGFVLVELPFDAVFSSIVRECTSSSFEHNLSLIKDSVPKRSNKFFIDLLMGTDIEDVEIIARSNYFEFDLNRQYVIHVLKFISATETISSETRSSPLAEHVFNEVATIMPINRRRRMIIWGNNIIFLVDSSSDSSPSLFFQYVSSKIPECIFSLGSGTLGMGIPGLRRSFREATYALQVGENIFGANRMYSFEELGFYRLLFEVKGTDNLKDFYIEVLAKLETYDREHRTDYIDTLETFFHFNGNYKRIAETMFIHYNSVGYRMGKIQRILGIDLDDEETRLNLQLGLKIKKILDRTKEGDLAV
jgi:sugar diacid utilization regulator